MTREFLTTVAALGLLYPTAGWSNECMATLKDPNGYTLVGSFLGGDDNEVTTTVKPGERFIAAPPYAGLEQDNLWRVYLKSGIKGSIDRNRIRLLPDEPLMKLNFGASKKEWRKLRSKPVTENDEAAGRPSNTGSITMIL